LVSLRLALVFVRKPTKRRMKMGKLVVSEFISLDGVVEDPGGAEGFERGGWAFNLGPEAGKFKLDEVMASDALLLGRVTYEGFAAAWPSRSGEFADKFNYLPKYVVSTTLKDPEWNNSTVIEGDEVAETVAGLKRDVEGDILINGSVEPVQTLMEHDLIDEYRLMVFPTILGAGKRLFGETGEAAALRLVEAKPADETLILVYEPSAKGAENA
jgi:dihydrofolate reductase